MERIDGVVSAIRFASDSFTVAYIQAAGSGEMAVVGDLAGIEVGQSVSFYGRSMVHPKHGPQFRVDYFHPFMEQTREGIRRFLVEEVSGIGPAFAERVVSYFYPLFGAEMLERLPGAARAPARGARAG